MARFADFVLPLFLYVALPTALSRTINTTVTGNSSRTQAPPTHAEFSTTAPPEHAFFRACPDGFTMHGQSCYMQAQNKLTIASAQEFCDMTGKSHILAIDSAEEAAFISHWASDLIHKSYMGILLDGTDAIEEGRWVHFNTLEPITFFLWYPNEPNDYNNAEDCYRLIRNNKMSDRPCKDADYFICEKKVTMKEFTIDGLPSGNMNGVPRKDK